MHPIEMDILFTVFDERPFLIISFINLIKPRTVKIVPAIIIPAKAFLEPEKSVISKKIMLNKEKRTF